MNTTAVDSEILERANSRRRPLVLRAIAGRLGFCKRGLSVVRDWKIYAAFSSPAYQQHNIARLQHLDSLGLDLSGKRVLEVGAGVGDHTLFYLHRNCRVLAVEGRPRLARKLSERFGIEVKVVDLDREPERLEDFGRFDLIHCYGLLYHLSSPERLLLSASRVADLLLLETCVSFRAGLGLDGAREDSYKPSQALHWRGCRPTRQWVLNTLKLRYEYVYATRTQPRHPEFPIDWMAPPPFPNRLTRAVFVASHTCICNRNLTDELPSKHDPW